MSRFKVVLIKDAQDDLTRIWVNTPERGAVTVAFDRIDRELAEAPSLYGTPLSEGHWKIYREPLKAFYSIDEIAKIVEISRIQFIPLNGAGGRNTA